MSDILDIASENEMVARAAAVSKIQNKPAAALATGYCLECGEPLIDSVEGQRWCDKDCRDDWQRWNPEA